jgi:hypothetical protein
VNPARQSKQRVASRMIGTSPCGASAPAGACQSIAMDNKPRVLLIDDDRSVLDALGTVIESEGCCSCPRSDPQGGRHYLTVSRTAASAVEDSVHGRRAVPLR